MGRLAKGQQPTPYLERLKLYRERLELSGGRRVIVDLGPEGAGALQAIMARDESTIKDAVTDSLVAFAQHRRPRK